ncbi:unnamed protein product [Ostreobium quekettii]|uniref:BZIP domain-containing protein n=1 Tax=Ostreobium quekettii TaxID=121088 RepID=A0A8S1JC87_9CHLO|nr:unnamed protein product [Ostreobium quekettii]|eukprot:evm.model.scf_83.2 EVM.evm.TU.scf_83.2   scf_83:84673-87780(+)
MDSPGLRCVTIPSTPCLQIPEGWGGGLASPIAAGHVWAPFRADAQSADSPVAFVLTDSGPLTLQLPGLQVPAGGWEAGEFCPEVPTLGRDVCMVDGDAAVALEGPLAIAIQGVVGSDGPSDSPGSQDLGNLMTQLGGGGFHEGGPGAGDCAVAGEDAFHSGSGGDDEDAPGPPVMSSEERRKLRNRKAQRKFRERQRVRISRLEEEVKDLHIRCHELEMENAKLEKENEVVRAVLDDEEVDASSGNLASPA